MAKYDRKDEYHQRAKREGFRSRAAYKLQEMQHSLRLLKKGQRVVDLGCWPGGWLQIAAAEVGPRGKVVGVDLAEMEPLEDLANVFAFVGDITEVADRERVLEELGGQADVLLSDAAPKLTGIRATDRAHEELLLESVEAATPALLAPGGDLLVKLLECPEAQAFEKRMRSRFEKCRVLKPKASRKGTTERYLYGRGYKAD